MSFPKIKRHPWRKAKTLAMLANRRQWNREFVPKYSLPVEIQAENGAFLFTESAKYLITE
jgi:hypothetical protein